MAYTTIDNPAQYFQTKLWTGNGSNNRAITLDDTDADLDPDMIWIKKRTDDVEDHALHDKVRGIDSNPKLLNPNGTAAEETHGNNGYISAVTADTFTLSTNGSGGDAYQYNNHNTDTYVAWCWKANGTGSSNTDGTINTAATSANTTSGFSIVSYTGNASSSQTVGHGLGAVPQWILSKNRDNTSTNYNDWMIYNHNLASANDKKLKLNETDAASSTNEWGDTDPTSTVYSVHTSGDGATNDGTDKIVSYVWTGIKGFSKFGTYTGNGNADGAFAYLGFRPAFVMVRDPGNAENWLMYDNKRPGFNLNNNHLFANTSAVETASSANTMDLLSNGFKVRSSNNGLNRSGATFTYYAFAESPFVNSNKIPNNAR